MTLPENLSIKLNNGLWRNFPSLAVVDEILISNPSIVEIVRGDIEKGLKLNGKGRGDSPSVDQVLRSALYKELRGVEYRELARHIVDSRICERFIGLKPGQSLKKSALQDYISKISSENLELVMIAMNKVAITWGLEELSAVRGDTTVVQTNVHYPTNASLVWDSIKKASDLLIKINKRLDGGAKKKDYEILRGAAKKYYYEINVSQRAAHKDLFVSCLAILSTFIKEIKLNLLDHDIRNVLLKKELNSLQNFLPLAQRVYKNACQHELEGKKVPNEEKLFSIYETHTDIIVKGQRDVLFGHKVLFASGKSNLILDCDIPRGNPVDSDLTVEEVQRIKENYNRTPAEAAFDGGFASKANIVALQKLGVKQIVFNKTVGSMQNIADSADSELKLKKWRAGMEAVISNIKRGFDLVRCTWRGWEHFKAKVFWSVIGYNARTMARNIVKYLKDTPAITA